MGKCSNIDVLDSNSKISYMYTVNLFLKKYTMDLIGILQTIQTGSISILLYQN